MTILANTDYDWMDRFVPGDWRALLFGTMALATRHGFITVTRDYHNLLSVLTKMDSLPRRTIALPADEAYRKAILRANKNMDRFGFTTDRSNALTLRGETRAAQKPPTVPLTPWQSRGDVSWPPRNVIFGIQVANAEEAEIVTPILSNMKNTWGTDILTAVHAPGVELDWKKIGITDIVDYIFIDDNFSFVDWEGRLM